MSLPDNTASSQAVVSALLSVDSKPTAPLIDYELGGAGINDPSQGMQVQQWKCFADCKDIFLEDSRGNQTVLLEVPGGVLSMSFTFDQNMNPAVVYVSPSSLIPKLYWFDTTIPAYVTLEFPLTRSHRLSLDDKRAISINAGRSDMILGYIRNNRVYYRQQRDRFTVEYDTDITVNAKQSQLRALGMGRNNRMHFVLS